MRKKLKEKVLRKIKEKTLASKTKRSSGKNVFVKKILEKSQVLNFIKMPCELLGLSNIFQCQKRLACECDILDGQRILNLARICNQGRSLIVQNSWQFIHHWAYSLHTLRPQPRSSNKPCCNKSLVTVSNVRRDENDRERLGKPPTSPVTVLFGREREREWGSQMGKRN